MAGAKKIKQGRPRDAVCFGTFNELIVAPADAAPAYRKPWIAFARQKFTRSGFDECSNHLN
jgi:hypothetical protein